MTIEKVRGLSDGDSISTAGRLVLRRDMGKITFATISDVTGHVQISLETGVLGDEPYERLLKSLSLGDIVGVQGTLYHTRRGELTIRVQELATLSKALRALPEKWKGVADPEVKARQRYLDLITSEETRRRFLARSRVVSEIRSFMEENDFIEVETPILQTAASGAMAKPFTTHHNALDIDLYLRIAPETFLKRVVVGGFDRVFEIGRNFRNEGMSPAHLQEFTMLEFYAAYWDYRTNMEFVRNMLLRVVEKTCGTTVVDIEGAAVDFGGEWKILEYNDLVRETAGVDIDAVGLDLDDLKAAVKAAQPSFDVSGYVSSATLIDSLYKRFCRPGILGPAFLVHHPAPLIPLARRTEHDQSKLAMFQVVVNGIELVKAYSELVDPIEQRERLEEQQALARGGEEETMMLEEEFLLAMEYGMPPMSGVGIGIDRLVAVLTGAKSVRDIVLFPTMRPVQPSDPTPLEG